MNRIDKIIEKKFPEKTETAMRIMKRAVTEVLKEIIIDFSRDAKNINAIKIVKEYLAEAETNNITKKK